MSFEKFIVETLIDDVNSYGDAIWEKNMLYASNLLDTGFPIEKMKNYQLHACIAYAVHYLDGAEVEDANSAKLIDDMRHTLWFCIWCLAENRMKTMRKLKSEV